MKNLPFRSGTSLIEMIIFMAFFAISTGAVLTLLLGSSEQRKIQEGISIVDQTGIQMMQTLSRRIQAAERVIYPSAGGTGTLLALQMASLEDDPTIIAVMSGAFVAQENENMSKLTSSGAISIENFFVRNTSPEDNIPSVTFSFDVSVIIGLPSKSEYARKFETSVSLFPDHSIQGNSCGCPITTCEAEILQWKYCKEGICTLGEPIFSCP